MVLFSEWDSWVGEERNEAKHVLVSTRSPRSPSCGAILYIGDSRIPSADRGASGTAGQSGVGSHAGAVHTRR